MLKRVWRWLFHRHKPTSTGVPTGISRGLSAYLSTSWRRSWAFDEDIKNYPGMCEPGIEKITQHVTQILPNADADAPTLPSRRYLFRNDETVADADPNKTQPIPALHR